MHRAHSLFLIFLLGAAAVPLAAGAQQATLKTAAATADVPFDNTEIQAEQQLLTLANRDRQQAGALPLSLDSGLSDAARKHAYAMLEARALSHRFDGEPSLPQRLAAMTTLQLDQEGENVALDYSASDGHAHLMLSPPHRANLLNPGFNVIGLAVVRSGSRLYIVQDFGHALPTYSPADAKNTIAAVVNQTRLKANMPNLPRRDLPTADAAACSMAQADKLGTAPVQQLAQRYTTLTYTTLRPEALPDGTDSAIASRNLRSFSLGACYAKTNTYPTGAYWIVLTLD